MKLNRTLKNPSRRTTKRSRGEREGERERGERERDREREERERERERRERGERGRERRDTASERERERRERERTETRERRRERERGEMTCQRYFHIILYHHIILNTLELVLELGLGDVYIIGIGRYLQWNIAMDDDIGGGGGAQSVNPYSERHGKQITIANGCLLHYST